MSSIWYWNKATNKRGRITDLRHRIPKCGFRFVEDFTSSHLKLMGLSKPYYVDVGIYIENVSVPYHHRDWRISPPPPHSCNSLYRMVRGKLEGGVQKQPRIVVIRTANPAAQERTCFRSYGCAKIEGMLSLYILERIQTHWKPVRNIWRRLKLAERSWASHSPLTAFAVLKPLNCPVSGHRRKLHLSKLLSPTIEPSGSGLPALYGHISPELRFK